MLAMVTKRRACVQVELLNILGSPLQKCKSENAVLLPPAKEPSLSRPH